MLITKFQPDTDQETVPHSRVAISLRDVLEVVSGLAVGGEQEAKLQVSAINTLARVSGCAPYDLPVDPARLRQHLATISPAMAGLTRSSWASVRSRVLKALQRADVPVIPGRRTKPLASEWAALWDNLVWNGRRAALGRFIGWLSDRGVLPNEVSDDVVERFAHDLNAYALRGSYRPIVRSAIRSWNEAVGTVLGWPQQRLTVPDFERKGFVLPAQSFTPGFQKSMADYLAYLADPPEDDEAPLKAWRPTTLKMLEFYIRIMASALVQRGVPIESLTSITDLAGREHVDEICRFYIERLGRPNSTQLYQLLSALRPIALRLLRDAEPRWLNSLLYPPIERRPRTPHADDREEQAPAGGLQGPEAGARC